MSRYESHQFLDLRPEIIKLDQALVQNVDSDQARQALVKGVVDACRALGCVIIAEGVETYGEFAVLSALGITLMQGYLFARPTVGSLPVSAAL